VVEWNGDRVAVVVEGGLRPGDLSAKEEFAEKRKREEAKGKREGKGKGKETGKGRRWYRAVGSRSCDLPPSPFMASFMPSVILNRLKDPQDYVEVVEVYKMELQRERERERSL